MKLAVLVALARAADAGRVMLDDSMLVRNEFASIADGSPYVLSAADDSDSLVYAQIGTRVSYRWLAERMITHSSNLATNLLLTVVSPQEVTATATRLGATRLTVLRGVEDNAAFRRGLNNATSARDLAVLLRAIASDAAASPAASEWMRRTLLAQAFNTAIPVGVPPGTRVAHKTGDITLIEHDAAIVYPPASPPYVLVVLTTGVAEQRISRALIADITRIVHPTMARAPR
jgi:beta-lactamase class A